MIEEFLIFANENDLFRKSDHILLTVSGGIDSMVMADLFLRAGLKTGIAHCNFNLRGSESDGDENFVNAYALRHKISFFSVSFDTAGFASEKGISIQMAARELRYRWFEEIRIKHGFRYIALAHNMNDNIETFLINLTRGTGVAGLTGMKPKNKNIIRPLLFASRKAIEDYSDQFSISYREDSSNSEVKYTRNKIRHLIMPRFREINPSFDSTITETATRLGEINDIVTEYISGISKKIIRRKDNMTIISLNELRKQPVSRTLVYELLRPFDIGSGQLSEIIALIEGKTGSQVITGESRLIKNRNEILIIPRRKDSEQYFEIESPDDFRTIPGCYSAEVFTIDSSYKIPSSSGTACIDADKILYPVIIREWIHGDYFYPLGMRKRKKLSDYFIDRKYSVPEKEKQLIMETGGRIAWIIGERIDNRFRVTGKTKKVLLIKFNKGSR